MIHDPLAAESDAVTIALAVGAGEVSPPEIVEAALRRIEACDRELSFMVRERFERARAEAEEVDRSLPLAGVPVLIKDFLATVAELPQTECSKFISGWTPERDSEYVSRLKAAGAIILGSVTSAELAVLSSCEPHRYGPTVNPVDPALTTGGSSGGSAAAVASAAVPVAHGSDAGGSIRMPAACCGVVGLKPTRGRNPLGPDYGDLGAGTWAEHVLSRSVRDSAAFLDATSGPAPGDPYPAPAPRRPYREAATSAPPPLRVGVSPSLLSGAPLHPDSAEGLSKVADLLAELGHHLEAGNPSFDLAAAEDDFFTLFGACLAARVEMWSQRLGREPVDDDLEPYTWHLVERGRACGGPEVMTAIGHLQHASREIAVFYESFDVWLSPTLGIPPFPLGYLDAGPGLSVEEVLARDAEFTAFTWPANMTGQPALSYPAHRSQDGTPIGIQLTGRYGDEDTLLALAGSLDQHLNGEGG